MHDKPINFFTRYLFKKLFFLIEAEVSAELWMICLSKILFSVMSSSTNFSCILHSHSYHINRLTYSVKTLLNIVVIFLLRSIPKDSNRLFGSSIIVLLTAKSKILSFRLNIYFDSISKIFAKILA